MQIKKILTKKRSFLLFCFFSIVLYSLPFGTKTDVEQMIGNAVPVNLAAYVGKAILRYQQSRQVLTTTMVMR